ncbi:hypothetical protein PoB_002170100 [Plakobranchus ocellatus]|uniref:SHSP domain-containing protein n=1 Tax=Plakobranchus ocellatus TaxID=259542 RepID=A0AAV3Z7B0_9GAST|nr:hypothetical protein PoB_002170100 [Plakobranchus ocellatus]
MAYDTSSSPMTDIKWPNTDGVSANENGHPHVIQFEISRFAKVLTDTDDRLLGEQGRLLRASPQTGDLRLPGPPSDQSAIGGTRTRNRSVLADLRAGSLSIALPTGVKKSQ